MDVTLFIVHVVGLVWGYLLIDPEAIRTYIVGRYAVVLHTARPITVSRQHSAYDCH